MPALLARLSRRAGGVPSSPIPSERRQRERHPHPPRPQATYDTFVAASGGLVAVARTTPDYRFPVAPAAAVARFHAARDAGHPPALSLFAVTEADAARLLETAFYAECLKVHVDGPASADLVRAQLARCGCRSGLLEANDFSDATAPTVRLAEVTDDAPLDLDALLDGVHGRVLLYDRAKNQAVAHDRASAPLDLAAAIAEADRLARARRPAIRERQSDAPNSRARPTRASAPGRRRRAEARSPSPRPISSPTTSASAPSSPPRPLPSPPSSPNSRAVLPPPEAPRRHRPKRPPRPTAGRPTGATHRPIAPAERASGRQSPNPRPPQAPHPLAPDLDRLRTDAYALLEDAVGRDRAAALDAHVRAEHGWPSPVPSEQHARPPPRAPLRRPAEALAPLQARPRQDPRRRRRAPPRLPRRPRPRRRGPSRKRP